MRSVFALSLMLISFPAVAASSAAAMVVALSAASSPTIPPEVVTYKKNLADQCEGAGGKPLPHKFIEHGYLGTDRIEVWASDEGQFQCKGAWSAFSGSGGAAIVVFMRLPDGHAKEVFNQGAYGMKFEKVGASSTLWGACRR